jgi:hypothetical protein
VLYFPFRARTLSLYSTGTPLMESSSRLLIRIPSSNLTARPIVLLIVMDIYKRGLA